MQVFKWITSKHKLPRKINKDTSVEVLVALPDKSVKLDVFSFKYSQWINYGKKVTHWGYKPTSPEEEL